MKEVKNIKGCIFAEEFKLYEHATNKEDFHVKGLLLPKDKVSRNGVLYDWESAKAKAQKFVGKTVNYNHIIDDDKKPLGRVEDITVKEEDDEKGLAGLYYDLKIDEDSEYADSIKKGYLNKVSLQVTADAQKEEVDDEGNQYTRAWIRDPLEISIVKVPGFDETTMEVALAEAFKSSDSLSPRKGINVVKKKLLKAGVEDEDSSIEEAGMSTANIPQKTKMAGEEDREACDNPSERSEVVEPLPEEEADPKELEIGIEVEKEHTDDEEEAKKIALQHLAEVPDYYSRLDKYVELTDEDAKELSALFPKEFMVVDSLMVLSDEEAEELLESFNEDQMGPYTYDRAKLIAKDMEGNDYRLIYSDKSKKWFFIHKNDTDYHFWGIKIEDFVSFETELQAIDYISNGKKIESLKVKETEELLRLFK